MDATTLCGWSLASFLLVAAVLVGSCRRRPAPSTADTGEQPPNLDQQSLEQPSRRDTIARMGQVGRGFCGDGPSADPG